MIDFEIVTPQMAFRRANMMANYWGISLVELCRKARRTPSTVYRWRTNRHTFDVSVYNALIRAHRRMYAKKKK